MRANRYTIFFLALLGCFILEFGFLSYRDSMAILRAGVPDEAMFIDGLAGYEDFFSSPLHAPFPQGFPGPYGHPFWLVLFVCKKFASFLGLNIYACLLAVFLSFKYIAAWTGLKTLEQRFGAGFAALLSSSIFLSPLLFFYGKIISPEFLMLCCTSLGCFFQLSRCRYASEKSIVWFFLATYIKVICLPFLLAALLIYVCHKDAKTTLKRSAFTGIILGTVVWSICWLSGGIVVTLHSILELPTPPAIWNVHQLWANLTTGSRFTWDQVRLLPLIPSSPVFCALAVLLAITMVFRRKRLFTDELAVKAGSICTASFAILLLLEAKGMGSSWYLLVPVVSFCLGALAWIAPLWNHRMLAAILAAMTVIGLPQAYANVRFEAENRWMLRAAQTVAPALALEAEKACGSSAFILFDVLIPYQPKIQDKGRIDVLSHMAQLPWIHNDISTRQRFVIVTRAAYHTAEPPYRAIFGSILPPLTTQKSTTDPMYQLLLSPTCNGS